MQNQVGFHCLYTPHFFTHLSADEYVGGFHILAIVNKYCSDMGVKISLQDPDFNSLEYIPIYRTAGLCGSFNF